MNLQIKVLLLFILQIVLRTNAEQLSFCPKPCECNGLTILCSAKGLRKVPAKLPPEVQRIDFQENAIATIRKDDFAGLRNLKVLQFMNNQLHTIETGAFSDLVSLQRLRLNGNQLRSLPDAMLASSIDLHRLDLSHNMLTILSAESMRGPTKMKNLQLDKNQLSCVDDEIIGKQTELEILTLNNNNLTTIDGNMFDNLHNLRVLRMHDNPWLCDCHLRPLAQFMQHKPRFARNVKCAGPHYLQGHLLESQAVTSLMKCSGSSKNPRTACAHRPMCPAACHCSETTVDCRHRRLAHIPKNLPAGTTELRLEQNDISYVPTRSFEYLKSLRRLDLSNNKIEEIAPSAFEGLDSLTSLVLYGNSLVELPSSAFRGLHNLQLLLLNANRLQCLRYDTFSELQSLSLLSLYDNSIKSIGNGTFATLKNLQTLHLARNPLVCDCNMHWLGAYLMLHPIETSGARCAAPKRVQRRRLAQLHPSKYRCKGSEKYITQGAGVCQLDFECPENCRCHETTVDCSQAALSSIPQPLPRFVTHLNMANNQLTHIDKADAFAGLENLRTLDLSGNLIEHVAPAVFEGAMNLETLDLSRNHLNDVNADMFAGTRKMKNLNISHNRINGMNVDVFNGNTELETITLSSNRIRCIAPGTFDKMIMLRALYLDKNDFICNCHMDWFINFLQTKDTVILGQPECAQPSELRNVLIKDLKHQSLKCDADSETASTCLTGGRYCPVGCLCVGTVVRCSNQGIKLFPVGLPVDTTELYLDNNELEYLPREQINLLTKLTKLDLSNNQINVIENHSMQNLTKLSTLIMSFNKLQCIEAHGFDGLSSLRILSLHANDLSMIPEAAFREIRNTLTHIALGSNPLYCDCGLLWLSDWIKRQYVEPGIARCDQPVDLHGQLALTASSDLFVCDNQTAIPTHVLSKCNACVSSPCENRGSCVPRSRSSGTSMRYHCHCAPGYHGSHCEHTIDACYGQPCMNNATCEALPAQGRFRCHCGKGFTGIRCEVNVDDCVGNQCRNGATCVDLVNDYKCQCAYGYAGWDCGKTIEYCSNEFNPCQNKAVCVPEKLDYKCICALGFEGRNCTENVDDCEKNLCQNAAMCVDGINSYSCSCTNGYSGRFCEIPPVSNALYPRTSPCHEHTCAHGFCVAQSGNTTDSDILCECAPGYAGERCDRLLSVSIDGRSNSYVRVESWQLGAATGNLTMTIRTTEHTGVLVYYGNEQTFVAAELFDGRVKVAYDVGNHPASHLYSYTRVDDGQPHRLQLVSDGQQITLVIDSNSPRSVTNLGPSKQFKLNTKEHLYLGGVPKEKAEVAFRNYHLANVESLNGCVSDVWLNQQPLDLSSNPLVSVTWSSNNGVTASCATDKVDVCRNHKCENQAECVPRSDRPFTYECKCKSPEWTGQFCERREQRCVKRKFTKIHKTVDGCRSRRPIKNARCEGWCGPNCCQAVRTKQRRMRLSCRDGRHRTEMVTIIRKCGCREQCDRVEPINAWRWRRYVTRH